ncbi:MAG: TonB family protein [Flavobacteriales bacterium]
MLRVIGLTILLTPACLSYAQTDTLPTAIDPAEMPSFPGGNMEMYKYIKENLRYPDIDAEGTVLVQFFVESDGSLSHIQVKRGVQKLLDEEAVRLVGTFPKWVPSKRAKQPGRVRYTLPIRFQRYN